MSAVAAALFLAATLQGMVTDHDAPLPGCTVTVTSGAVKREAISDVNGMYRIEALEPGTYELTFALDSFAPDRRTVELRDGVHVENASPRVLTEEITLTCGGPSCSSARPETVWDLPLCDDVYLERSLIENATAGDQSAIAILEHRYETATTWQQRHALASALLGRAANDTRYWNDLFEHAKMRVSIKDVESEEYKAWCAERNLPPDEYYSMSWRALDYVAVDPRAKRLLLDMLAGDDRELVQAAIYGFSVQHDLSVLPDIEKAIRRFPEDVVSMAEDLAYWKSPAADDVAARFLGEDELERYREVRQQLDREP